MIVKWKEEAVREFACSIADLVRQWKVPKVEQDFKYAVLSDELFSLINDKIAMSGFYVGSKKDYFWEYNKQIIPNDEEIWVKPVTYKNKTWFVFFTSNEDINTRIIEHVSDNQQLIILFGRH
jgi:hypothetical protein